MYSEKEIIEGLRNGNENAYKYLYQQQYKILCIVAYEYVKDELVSEMIVSDVIFTIWRNRESLLINTSLRNYLIKSVCNRCVNYCKQMERQNMMRQHILEKNEKEQNDYENNQENPLVFLIEKELDLKINECIDALPALTRRIFCLSRFDDLKYAEIADQTGVSVDVVKYHIKSALSQLRIKLKDYLITILILLLSFV